MTATLVHKYHHTTILTNYMGCSRCQTCNPIHLFFVFSLLCYSVAISKAATQVTATVQNDSGDLQALLMFKAQLSDRRKSLASWDNTSVPYCRWSGVTCDHQNPGRVIALDFDSRGLSGQVSRYIGNLTFLQRIHLPNNQLSGHIPEELGRLSNLQYLNMSRNSLQGEIPASLSSCLQLQNISLRDNELSGNIPTNLSLNLKILSLSNNNLSGEIPPSLTSNPSLSAVDLSNNSLIGSIPDSIGSISSLYYLNLSYNGLTGQIPKSLGSNSGLAVLDLARNNLEGSIPSSIASGSSLLFLDLSRNKLSGHIPASIGTSSSLYHVDLQANNLIGPIPPFMNNISSFHFIGISNNFLSGEIPPSLGNQSNLNYLYLANNELEGNIPNSFGSIPNLVELDLSINKLSGTIPPSLYKISSLTFFGVGDNQLVGEIPTDIGLTLPNLQYLIMQRNQFHGEIPVSLLDCSELLELDLENNLFTGLIPSNIGSLSKLQQLLLGWNQLEADGWDFLSSLSNCTDLERLSIYQNKIEGPLPSTVGNLSKKLDWLLIGKNKINGPIPPEIGNLANLTVLFMDESFYTGEIPATIGNLRNLRVFYLPSNNLSGAIPDSLGNLKQLNELYLQENKLSGRVPASFGNLQNLISLNLSHNSLAGTIPEELVSISSLTQFLDLSYNLLQGSLPKSIGNLKNLGHLYISNNQLSNKIPSTLGECVLLETLRLEGNLLNGSIPDALRNLEGIEELDLSRNNLSGHIPQFLETFTSLAYLNLSFNDFDGEVPYGGAFANQSEVYLVGNKRLCGGNPWLFLQPCSSKASRNGARFYLLRIVIPLAGFAIVFSLCLYILICRKKKPQPTTVEDSFCKTRRHQEVAYADIFKATDGFSPDNLVGEGSFGTVYRGKLEFEMNDVAVKVFNLNQMGGPRSFIAECEALRNIRHRNLIRIITSCSTLDSSGNEFKAQIFEYMPNGSLDEWLHPTFEGRYQKKKLTLTQRLDIALDIASALSYLHNNFAVPVVHCDLKPSNILLNDHMVAHVTDFGLAKLLIASSTAKTVSSTTLMGLKGSIGYIPPEYGFGAKTSSRGDVYSYGVILLEILTGKRPTDDMFTGDSNLHKYVCSAFATRLPEVLDPRLISEGENANVTQTLRNQRIIIALTTLAIKCSMESPKERITMREVVDGLHSIKEAYPELE